MKNYSPLTIAVINMLITVAMLAVLFGPERLWDPYVYLLLLILAHVDMNDTRIRKIKKDHED